MIDLCILDIIESASGNTAGTTLDKNGISRVVSKIVETGNLRTTFIDDLITKYQTESGYLLKAIDFISILTPYMHKP